jgi:hypothetical protein
LRKIKKSQSKHLDNLWKEKFLKKKRSGNQTKSRDLKRMDLERKIAMRVLSMI